MKSVITWEIERNIQFTHLQRKRYDTSCLLWLHYYSHYVFVPNKCTEEQTSDFAARIVFRFQCGMMAYVSYSFCHWHYQTKPTRATSISIPTVETSCLYPIPVMFGRSVCVCGGLECVMNVSAKDEFYIFCSLFGQYKYSVPYVIPCDCISTVVIHQAATQLLLVFNYRKNGKS